MTLWIGLALVTPSGAEDATEAHLDPALEGWVGLEDVDEATLRDLDELLQHPVSLDENDVDRLRWVPWITPRQWNSLVQALPVRSARAWGRLPEWTPAAVERLLPFVTLTPEKERPSHGRFPSHWQSDLLLLRSGTRSRLQAAHGALRVAVQLRRELPGEPTGALSWRSRSLLVVAGDQRRSTAAGLLLSTRALSSRAGGATRSAARWSASTSAWRDRVVRGKGIQWRRASFEIGLQDGVCSGDRLQVASLAWRRSSDAWLQVASLRRRRHTWVSLFAQHGPAEARIGSEVVVQPRGAAAAFFVRRSLRRRGLEALVITAPWGLSSPLAAAPRSAQDSGWVHVRARGTWSMHTARVRLAWTRSLWSTGDVRRHDDLLLEGWQRLADVTLEAQWRSGRDAERAVGFESLAEEVLQEDERLVLRARLDVGRCCSLLLERRSRHVDAGGARAIPASGWRLAWCHEGERTRLDVSLLTFDATAGESIVFSEPAVGRAPALFTASERGMRLALRLRTEWNWLRASVRAAAGWDRQGDWQPVVEGALRFRTFAGDGF